MVSMASMAVTRFDRKKLPKERCYIMISYLLSRFMRKLTKPNANDLISPSIILKIEVSC